MKKKIFYIGGITGNNAFYIYKKYGPELLHSGDAQEFNTLKEAKDWAIGGYRTDINDAKVGIMNIKELRKDTVPWGSEVYPDEEEEE